MLVKNEYVIMSAQIKNLPPEINKRRHDALIHVLNDLGASYSVTNGYYDGFTETSVMIRLEHFKGFNEEFFAKKVNLKVIQMKNWKRVMWMDETGLFWVKPSPNMPNLNTAIVYPGQVYFEGTNLSEGRGTTNPFEIIGAPWIDPHTLSNELNDLKLDGVKFREVYFTPYFSKFKEEICYVDKHDKVNTRSIKI